MRVVKQKVRAETGEIITDKDILDWIKYVQSETDGVKLDLSKLLEREATDRLPSQHLVGPVVMDVGDTGGDALDDSDDKLDQSDMDQSDLDHPSP
jgi:hypothetical protein